MQINCEISHGNSFSMGQLSRPIFWHGLGITVGQAPCSKPVLMRPPSLVRFNIMIVRNSQLITFLLGSSLFRNPVFCISDYGKRQPVGDVHTTGKLPKLTCNSPIKLDTSDKTRPWTIHIQVQKSCLTNNSIEYVPLGETKAIKEKELTQKPLFCLERNEWGRGWTRGTATSRQSEIREIIPTRLVIDLGAGRQRHVN